MKLKEYISYGAMFLFLGWCLFTFRADISHIDARPVWAARYAVLGALALSLLNYGLRVARWHLYLVRLNHRLPLHFSALTYVAGFAFTLSPGKIGEMVRARYYQKIGIPLSSTGAAFFIERLIDLLSMLTLALLALASNSSYAPLMWGAALAIALMFGLFVLMPWIRVFEFINGADWFPEKFRKLGRSTLRAVLSAQVLLKPQMLVVSLVIGLCAWGAEGTGLMVIGAIAPGVPLDWSAAVGIYAVAIIVGALSFLPGGLGSTEAVMVALLAARGFSVPDAILITLVCRVLTLWFAVLIGWIVVGLLRYFPSLGDVS